MRDPHYRKILEELAGPLDPQLFEECAVDLLRSAYPGLVPIHGGHDYGMDGAIADGEGEAYPFIVTTANSVIRNLTKNLESYIASGGPRRLAVVATSTALTPTQRRNLENRARDNGFTLLQVHDRWDFASRLYRNSHWTKELLGITGEPPALSSVPQTRRPLREDVELVGRDADLPWLRTVTGDRLVVGQPGSGKTRLLFEIVRGGRGLFLASDDEERIANACRDLEPAVIIVDDAHFEPERLDRLRHLREEIGATFDIIATTWPGAEGNLADALGGLPGDQVRHLELLTRAEILEVLRGMGVQEPDDDPYLRQLVDQASNKPGLAMTLGSLWLRGEWRKILTGEAIRRTLIPSLTRVLEHDPTQLLACFALGGDAGVSMQAVGDFLGMGLGEVRHRATLASQGGVLRVLREGRLSVEPELLRYPLLQEVFFTGGALPSLPYGDLLAQATDPGRAVETLTLASLREVPVPRAELRDLVADFGTSEAWRAFAVLGGDEGRWVLDNYPGPLQDIAREVLRSVPREAVRRLLDEAATAEGPLHSNASHPLRILEDWIKEIPSGRSLSGPVEESLRRRRLLVEVALEHLEGEGDQTVDLRACFIALNPRLESARETATGGAVTIRRGILPPSRGPDILNLWSQVYPRIDQMDKNLWSQLAGAIHNWSHPRILGIDVSDEETEKSRAVARDMLQDLAMLPTLGPGLTQALQKLAARIGSNLALDRNEDFETLFPSVLDISKDRFQEDMLKRQRAARELAARWSLAPPGEVAHRLVLYSREAAIFGQTTLQMIPEFLRALAEKVEAPEVWLEAFQQQGLDPAHGEFLLERIVRERPPGWEAILAKALVTKGYDRLAAYALLRSEVTTADLVERALEVVGPQMVETACMQGGVPLGTVAKLLQHPNEEIAFAAAVGEWLLEPRMEVRPEIQSHWREAVLRAGAEDQVGRGAPSGSYYWLETILESNSDLAFAWLERRLRNIDEYEVITEEGVYASAVKGLSSVQRTTILDRLEPSFSVSSLIPLLVDRSPEVYGHLLSRHKLKPYHLDPLAGTFPDGAWKELAGVALEAGYAPSKIASAICRPPSVIWGFGEEHWGELRQGFEALLETVEGRLRQIAEHGLTIAQSQIEDAGRRKRQFELTGKS